MFKLKQTTSISQVNETKSIIMTISRFVSCNLIRHVSKQTLFTRSLP